MVAYLHAQNAPIYIAHKRYNMKNKKFISLSLILLCILAMSVFSLSSCDDEDEQTGPTTIYFTATFDFKNGDEPYVTKVADGSLVTPPIPPERENYIFNGWKRKGYIWNFSKDAVFEDIEFAAQWIDASSIFTTQKISDSEVAITSYSGFLTEIRIPEIISGFTVTAIGDEVFKDYSSGTATMIVLPSTVKSVGDRAFSGCSEITVEIMGTLDHIGDRAFENCAKLKGISLSEKVTSIPYKAFAGCTALEEIKIPKSVLTVGEDSFNGCSAIKTMILSAPSATVENAAFANCGSLVTVFFEGTKEEWENVKTKMDVGGGGNDNLLEAKIYFYSETEADGDFWHYTDKGEPRCW
jgi:hypothetical protein